MHAMVYTYQHELSYYSLLLTHISEPTKMATLDHTGPPHNMCLYCDNWLRVVKQIKVTLNLATFIDFKKAFDSTGWAALDNILSVYGIPPRLCNAVMALYYGAKVVVTTADGEADPFNLSAGVLQGDTLAPYLFVLVVDYISRCACHSWQLPWLHHQSTCGHPITNIYSCSCSIRPGLCKWHCFALTQPWRYTGSTH